MTDSRGRPTRCKQCGWNQAEPGYPICSNCARRILRETCTHPWKLELVILRSSNGYQHPKFRCPRCSAHVGSPKLKDVNPDEADALIVNEPKGACAHCGRTDAIERHHWAPWHLFDDPDAWPTSLLCPDCHRLWHTVTRTGSSSADRAAREREIPVADPWSPAEGWDGGTF